MDQEWFKVAWLMAAHLRVFQSDRITSGWCTHCRSSHRSGSWSASPSI